MKERLVLVRTTGYRTVFLVMGVLAVGLLVTWVIGTLVGGAGPGNLNSVVAPLLIGTVAAAFFFFLSVATFYTVLELEDTDLIFTGIFGRTATFPIALLDRVGVGRGSYSFAFKPPEKRVAELYTYLNAKHFEEVLRKIAERKPDPGLSFTFEYGKTPVTY